MNLDAAPAAGNATQPLHHARAQGAFELAEHALRDDDPAGSGGGAALAAQLFSQSIYWSLLARSSAFELPAPDQLFAQHEAELVRLGAPGSGALPALRGGKASDAAASELLATLDFAAAAQRTAEQLRAHAVELERIAAALLGAGERSLRARQRKQLVRVAAAFATLGVVLFALTAVALGMLSKPNLAQGKPWTTSSVFADCDPVAKRCGGVSTAVFFHTNEEENPWLEIDLGKPEQFSSLTILNRSDAVQERAVPLVLEISNDRKAYQELAKRKEVFDVWEPSFPPKRARYVRLRVARKSFLHLDGVEVHP